MMKKCVQAVIFNDKGEVLSVSRKDDHNDAGLAGGKVDPEDSDNFGVSTLHSALIREVKEETGLDIDVRSAELIFAIHKGGYMGYTYLIKDWSGVIETDEPHVVMWTTSEVVCNGSFGVYNRLVFDSLTDMGINFI